MDSRKCLYPDCRTWISAGGSAYCSKHWTIGPSVEVERELRQARLLEHGAHKRWLSHLAYIEHLVTCGGSSREIDGAMSVFGELSTDYGLEHARRSRLERRLREV